MVMNRLPNWESRLAELVNRNRKTPYAYGVFDCATFARKAVYVVTGVELLPGHVQKPGFLEAAKFLIKHGWGDVDDMATELLGPAVDLAFSRPGDIVSFIELGEIHLAVRVGSEAVTPAADGLKTVAPQLFIKTWMV